MSQSENSMTKVTGNLYYSFGKFDIGDFPLENIVADLFEIAQDIEGDLDIQGLIGRVKITIERLPDIKADDK